VVGAEVTVYLDTHVVVWVYQSDIDELSPMAARMLDSHDLMVSPTVLLELELLHEIGRIKISAEKLITELGNQIDLQICPLSYQKVVEQAVNEKWTRDPFDRLIVANAKAAGAPLLTRDERIRKHYRRALW
jgi:PIN domain nuclease of toxin-antitoxin system